MTKQPRLRRSVSDFIIPVGASERKKSDKLKMIEQAIQNTKIEPLVEPVNTRNHSKFGSVLDSFAYESILEHPLEEEFESFRKMTTADSTPQY